MSWRARLWHRLVLPQGHPPGASDTPCAQHPTPCTLPQFLRLLGAEREVLAFDNIGVGQTVDSSGEGLTLENMAASTLELLAKLNLTQVGLNWAGPSGRHE